MGADLTSAAFTAALTDRPSSTAVYHANARVLVAPSQAIKRGTSFQALAAHTRKMQAQQFFERSISNHQPKLSAEEVTKDAHSLLQK